MLRPLSQAAAMDTSKPAKAKHVVMRADERHFLVQPAPAAPGLARLSIASTIACLLALVAPLPISPRTASAALPTSLATTAETEHAITKAQLKQTARPATAVSQKDLEITDLLPKLLDAIDSEHTFQEDKYQAQVCVGWLHWAVGEYSIAVVRLPSVLEQDPEEVSEWTRVCTLKAAYLKANCLSREDQRVQALAVFEGALASLSAVWTGQRGRKQLQFWAELFLTEFCMLQAQALERGEKTLEDPNVLAAFRSWARYWENNKNQGTPLVGGHGFRGAVPRRRIWSEYYTALSAILEQGLPFPAAHVPGVVNEGSARNQLRIELKKVEAAYESLLLSETSFPRADEDREEIETFVGLVMKNWTFMSGRNWQEHDLGQGGKEGISRGVLEILYRAATKTFHSTAILRHLFTLHLAVAEFDLAFKAFNSYLEIVKKGKARIDKTGHPEPSLDDDATVLETVSTAITALCKYGFQDEAETAYSLGSELEHMLQKLPAPIPNADENITSLPEENANGVVLHPRIPASINALAWQAIGVSQAQWARMTFDAASRTEIQAKAIRSFQKSLSPDTGNPTDVRTLFALGLLLAEQRELSAAIDIVKAALMSNKKTAEQNVAAGTYWRERSLIPLWHLLALLLSARQDYVMAARACEGAFEQFDDPTVLFGTQGLQGQFRSDHLNEAEAKDGFSQSAALVDEMDDVEKESIIEVKMTQLALIELLEGPEIAVNASHELLVLYTRLFGSLQPNPPAATQQSLAAAPKSSAGTLRSFRGSIFGRGRAASKLREPSTLKESDTVEEEKSESPERPQTAQTNTTTATTAPTIQITRDNTDLSDSRSRKSAGSVRGRRSESAKRSDSVKRGNSLKKRDSSSHQRRRASSSGTPRRTASNSGAPRQPVHQPTITDGDAYFTPLGDSAANDRPDFFAWSTKNHISSQQSFSKGRGLLRFDSTTSSIRGTTPEPFTVDSLSSPNSLPILQFPEEQIKRQRQTILVKVWLMIAAFYRRAQIHRDAHGAIDEAKKLVGAMEADIAKDTSGSVAINHPGWGGKKSIEELWADVHSEMGYLSVAEDAPYKGRAEFEEALMHFSNHPAAIVGLSNILLDIYTEVLLPTPAVPGMAGPDGEPLHINSIMPGSNSNVLRSRSTLACPALPSGPLGLGWEGANLSASQSSARGPLPAQQPAKPMAIEELPAPYKARSLPLLDRLTARDRAYGLLSGLTKLGTGWNYSDAWFALARAHEESGQPDKAKEALWWCVELEEGLGVREWNCVGAGGYVL
ncbi:putative Filamentation protein [Seiridium unicorne]|uniref:Filamentation protein n=1 Tax=Seiridium unicorne TaxID=138068 RepID=A0ABR2UX83_9PEZI